MPGTINTSMSLSGTGNSTNFTIGSLVASESVSFTTDAVDEGVVSISNSTGTWPSGQPLIQGVPNTAGGPGKLFLRNLDTTNFVTYGSSSFEFQLDPGEFAWQRIKTTDSSTLMKFRADTAPVKVQFKIIAD